MKLASRMLCALAALLGLLLPAGVAQAQSQLILPNPSEQEQAPSSTPQRAPSGVIERAADALRSSPVYVDDDAERAISGAEATRIRERISQAAAGPLYLAILPRSAADAAGGDPDRALALLAERVAQPGTYVSLIGGSLRAGATSGVLPRGEAGSLARQSLGEHGDEGTLAVLLELVDRVGRARASGADGGASGESGGSSGLVLLLVILGIPGLLLVVSRLRRRVRTTPARSSATKRRTSPGSRRARRRTSSASPR